MEEDNFKKIYDILNKIPQTQENAEVIEEIRMQLLNKDYIGALKKIEDLNKIQKEEKDKKEKEKAKIKEKHKAEEGIYPKELSNIELEKEYMGLLLNDPKLIVKYYFPLEECYFEDDNVLNAYKSVLFT